MNKCELMYQILNLLHLEAQAMNGGIPKEKIIERLDLIKNDEGYNELEDWVTKCVLPSIEHRCRIVPFAADKITQSEADTLIAQYEKEISKAIKNGEHIDTFIDAIECCKLAAKL